MSFRPLKRGCLKGTASVLTRGCILMIGLAVGSGCTETNVYSSDGPGSSPPPSSTNPGDNSLPNQGGELPGEAIEPGPMGYVFEYEDLEVSTEAIEIRPSKPFLQFEAFIVTEEPLLQYQLQYNSGQWSEWETFVPDGSHSGTFAGVVTLENPATALRFITETPVEYIHFEFFEEPLEFDDHDHEHEDDTALQNDPDYAELADADGLEGDEDLDERPSGLSVRQQELITSCNKRRMAAYSRGRRLPDIEVIQMDGKNVGVNTGSAYEKMRIAAARNGVNITVVSGFRTMDEQTYLYNCYRTKRCNNGNLAARPGYSNHQNGLALDLNTRARGVLSWLNNNAATYGFRRTVRSEPWHWEYTAGRTVSPQICSGGSTTTPDPTPETNPRTCSATTSCATGMDCIENQCVTSSTLRFTLTWQARTDVDLHVLTPTGEELWYRNRNTADGGVFDSDSCIGTRCQTDSVLLENVFWRGAATEGNYTFWSVNYSGTQSVPVVFDVKVNGERNTFESTVPAGTNSESYKFVIHHPSGELVGQ